jgi:poly-gamma-glutamate capsule biosynthesis protein CapA/YwtB (metallophosphatase superfamily)
MNGPAREWESASESATETILSVGDIMLGGRVGEQIESKGLDYPFGSVEEKLRRGDLVFGNLEVPFDGRGRVPYLYDTHPDFKAKPEHAASLKLGHFDILSLANNHIMDWGEEVALETRDLVRSLGIETVGAGATLREAQEPVIVRRDGVTWGFLAYAQQGRHCATRTRAGANPMQLKRACGDIGRLRSRVDVLVVSLHSGLMFTEVPSPFQVRASRMMVDHGADLVLGHHPHVIQGIEKYKNGLIAYSLGEFVADQEGGKAAHYRHDMKDRRRDTMILSVSFHRGDRCSYDVIPCRIEEFRPRVLLGEDSERLANTVAQLSALLIEEKDFWLHAGSAVGEDVFRVFRAELGRSGLRAAVSRIRRLRFRHLLLLLGYLRGELRKRRAR